MKKVAFHLALALTLISFTLPAQATPTLDFNISPPTLGSISWAGDGTPLRGFSISVDTVAGIGGTCLHNNQSLDIVNGFLNFTTGPFISISPGEYDFAPGGSITVTGAIPAIGISNTNTVLLSGTFTPGPFTPHVGISAVSGGDFIANFTDDKNPTLAAYFGLIPTFLGGNINLSFNTLDAINPNIPDPFSSSEVASGDLRNFGTCVPLPPSFFLLGSALIGIVGLRFRIK